MGGLWGSVGWGRPLSVGDTQRVGDGNGRASLRSEQWDWGAFRAWGGVGGGFGSSSTLRAQRPWGGTVRGFPLFGKVQKERRSRGVRVGMLTGDPGSVPPCPPIGSCCHPTPGAAFGVSPRCLEVPSTIFCVREGFPTSGKR